MLLSKVDDIVGFIDQQLLHQIGEQVVQFTGF
jgi:hypothetical protein